MELENIRIIRFCRIWTINYGLLGSLAGLGKLIDDHCANVLNSFIFFFFCIPGGKLWWAERGTQATSWRSLIDSKCSHCYPKTCWILHNVRGSWGWMLWADVCFSVSILSKCVNFWHPTGCGHSAGKNNTTQTWSQSVEHIWILSQYNGVVLVLLLKHV